VIALGLRRVLTVIAVGGPVIFTAVWLSLGLAHRRYSLRTETISALSAHNAPGWPVMVVGQLVLAAGLFALAALTVDTLGRRGAGAAILITLGAAGTVQASIARTICFTNDGRWCTPLPRSAYPSAQWVHGIGTGIVFSSIILACFVLAWAVAPISVLDDVRWVSIGTATLGIPLVLWFLRNVQTSWHGFAEKLFLLALGGWASYVGYRLGTTSSPGRPGPIDPFDPDRGARDDPTNSDPSARSA
jgi:hypothetical protein